MGEMENEIYIIDENNQEHRLKYLDEERVIVQPVTRYRSDPAAIGLGMPCKVSVTELDPWPYTDGLKRKITEFHAEFTNAK